MTIANVEQDHKAYTIRLGVLPLRGKEPTGPTPGRRLWIEDRDRKLVKVLLGGPEHPISPGVKGVEQCIRFVVENYGQKRDGSRPEFDLHEMKDRKERRRLLSMAGGLLSGARMTVNMRKERAMKAALARYQQPKVLEEKACDGSLIKCWSEHLGNRHWQVICTVDGAELFRRDCRSWKEVASSFDSAKVVLEFKKFAQEYDRGNQ